MNLNPYAGLGSHIPSHCDNEALFGPQNSPELTVSMSLGYSVEFQVRCRALDDVSCPIRLDHGDLLVMDGLAQSECAHRTVSGLQGPRVNLTRRWRTQYIASCPVTGVMCCALPSCVEGLAEPGLPGRGRGETKWTILWLVVSLLSIWVCLDYTLEAALPVVSAHPTWCCAPGKGVGDCRVWLPWGLLWGGWRWRGGKNHAFFGERDFRV